MPAKSKKTSNKSAQSGPISKSASYPTNAQRPAKQDTSSTHHSESLKSSQPEPDSRTGDTTESAGEPTPVPIVNRKKQKRREKEAAKRTGGQQDRIPNGSLGGQAIENGQLAAVKQGRGPVKGYFTEETDYVDPDFQDHLVDAEEEFYSNDEDIDYVQNYSEGPDSSWLNTSKRKKSLRKRSDQIPAPNTNTSTQKPFPTLSNAALRSAHKMSNSNDHIWNTSTQAERENIKQFWLELGEDERRSLVRVEKEAVLRKMKEQQKHSCSCSVCGRKRTAIEEELEVLYDAYYQELEQFANHNNETPESPQSMPPPRTNPVYRTQHPMAGAYPAQGQIHDLEDDAEDLDDEDDYDDDDEDEDDDEDAYSDEDYDDELPPGPADFYQFGNSLTVKDGILTVADDLLKNDGKHFIDMMEQLAERRMQREEEIHYPAPPLAHQNLRQGHNHPPIDDDDDYDEDDDDDDEDYDSQEEDDFEGDEMDSMTEEQRMEEGRRMFQIFAARMFEQRVLTAYKEKVAHERQQKLLEELEEEVQKDTQREAKKAKEAAKKKEKKARQKAAKDEEKAKREAEKAMQEAAAREEEEKKAAEKRAKQEEQRKKREQERKALEQEKAKKEAEKVQRAQKERERQQEAEKKARDTKEREKKQREEQRKKERDERELKEAEAKERRVKEEQDRKEREAQQRKEKEATARAEREARKSEQTSRPQAIALPPGLHPASRNVHAPSPHPVIATPVMPTPSRSRQPSQPSQQSHSSSPRSQKASTDVSQTSVSPANVLPQPPGIVQQAKHSRQGPPLHHPQPSAPRSPLSSLGRGNYLHNYGNMQGMGVNGTTVLPPGHLPNSTPMHMYAGPPILAGQRFPTNGMHMPPGINAPRPFQNHQHTPYHQPPPMTAPTGPSQQPVSTGPAHSRQFSGSETVPPPAPIARPGPIARPLSTTPDKPRGEPAKNDASMEKITAQLGSSALLDDSDEPFVGQVESRQHPAPLGAPGTGRIPFASSFSNDKPAAFGMGSSNWGSSFNSSHGGHFSQGGHRGMAGWPQPLFDPMRTHVPRPIAVRLLLVQACRQLTALSGGKGDGYHPAREVLRQVEQIKPPGDPLVSMDEMLGICDTEGNVQNGGGTFEVMIDNIRGQIVKFVEDNTGSVGGRGMGDIGSSIAPSHQVSSFGSIGQGVQHQHQGFGPPGSRNF